MASREVWSKKGSFHARELLASLFASLLLGRSACKPLYVFSAYLSDFPLFDNAFGQFQALFTRDRALGEKPEILFSEALGEISSFMPVRIVAVQTDTAEAFLQRVLRRDHPGIMASMATSLYHEKGMLCELFYVQGSMNFTFSGVYLRDEKIVVHTPDDAESQMKLMAATLEFERLWENRKAYRVEPE
jgi:hypothetical protein